jgi:O-antigen/teichoic acid export membrane protein
MLLRLINKLVKEDNFLSLAGNLVIAVFGFGGFALLARSLSPEDFAKWVLFISGGSLIEMLRYGITNNGLIRFLAGANEEYKIRLIGSNIIISAIATLVIVLLLLTVNALFHESIDQSAYSSFFVWYPLLSVVNLPWNNAVVVQQAKMNYGKILSIRAINSTFFFGFLIINFVVLQLDITDVIIAYIIFNAMTSVFCMYKSWDGLRFVGRCHKETITTLLNFGKYSTFTLIGTNLLRNADVLIISISPFGSAAVALFSIPLKLTELQQIPLRSFAATAFPKMSKASIEGKIGEVKLLFHVYSGAMTYFFFFLSLGTFLFAKQFVILISGYEYLDVQEHGINIVTIVRILSIYGLLLPIDRMTGIGLDSINQPKINAIKVFIMLFTNILGDLIAIYVFKSIEMVAVSTLLFTTVGIVVGWYFLEKKFEISIKTMAKTTHSFYKSLWDRSFRRVFE